MWRQGWKGRVQGLAPEQADWCEALAAGLSIGDALQRAGKGFGFEPWLIEGLQQGWVSGVRPL